MARAARTRKARAPKSVKLDLSKISKAFEANEEYAFKVVECTLEEGEKAPYFNLKLNGLDDDYADSVIYHMASTSESSLWRLRPLIEALGIDIPEGEMDLGPEDFVGKTCMGSTYLDRYEGGSRVRIDEFWPLDGEAGGAGTSPDFDLDDISDDDVEALAEQFEVKGRNVTAKRKALAKLDQEELAEAHAELGGDAKGADAAEEFDLDELTDEQIEALAEAMEVKGRNVAAKKKALAKLDADELAEAFADLDVAGGEAAEFDLDELDDEQIEALAEAMEVKGRTIAAKRKALAKLDADELAEAHAELEEGGDDKKSATAGGKVSSDEVNEMNEDDLEDLIEQNDLEVDLSAARTLKKKRTLVLDALEEADLLED